MAIIQKSFSDLVDFTRGSEATGWVNGQLKTFGIDEPRFVTDPVTGEALGLLVEGQATNLLLWSEDWLGGGFLNGWSHTTSTHFAYRVQGDHPERPGLDVYHFGPNTGEDGNSNNSLQQIIDELGPTGEYFIRQDIKAVPGGRNVNAVRFTPTVSGGGSGTLGGVLRLSGEGGVISDGFIAGDSFASQEIGSYPIGNGWYRCWIRFTTTRHIGRLRAARSFPYSDNSAITGDGEAGLLGTMAQLEQGTHPTSYIPTEGSQVTRAADYNMVSLPHQNSNRGVSLCIDLTSFVFGNYSAALFANNPFEGYMLLCAGHSTPEGFKYGITVANLTGSAFFPLPGLEENKRHKLSVGWLGRSFVAFLDGVKVVDEIDVGLDIPSFNELNLFSNSDVGLASGSAGVVSKVAYYPTRLPDSQLAALTEF